MKIKAVVDQTLGILQQQHVAKFKESNPDNQLCWGLTYGCGKGSTKPS